MLNLHVIRSLNSSASGVLYHYTNSMANVESIIENGLKTSAYPTSNPDEYQAGVSLSRTKTTIPYVGNDTHTHGYADDENGTEYKRWVYGVIFSKALLSNVGKIRPYEWMTDLNWRKELNIYRVNQNLHELPENWLPESITLDLIASWYENEDSEVHGRVSFRYPEDTVDNDDYFTDKEEIIISDKPYLPRFPKGTSKDEFDDTVSKLDKLGLDKDMPIPSVVRFTGTIRLADLDSQPKLIQNIVRDAIRILERRIQRRRIHQQTSKAGNAVKIWIDSDEPVYLPDRGDTSYENISKALVELSKIAPKLTISGSEEEGWRIWGYFPSNVPFVRLPVPIQKVLNKVGLSQIFESEDRMLVKDVTPGEYLPATRKAIIGIIVPRAQYYSNEVEAFRKKHPDIPVYAYAEKNESSNPAADVPKEAYRSPVA